MNNNKIYCDYLGRMQIAEDITSIVKSCVKSKKPTAFSIEGEWGKGKTWLVERIADSLEGIDLTLAKDSQKASSNEYLVIRYNAWEKDYYEEPLLAILITIINHLNKQLVLENILKAELVTLFESSQEILEDTLRVISKRIIGIDVINVVKQGVGIFKKIKEIF